MAITNISRPSTSLVNATRPQQGETWATITTTWASETRTWGDTGQLIDNISRGAIGFLWSVSRFPWTEVTPWLSEGGMTNQVKPIP